MGLADGLDMGCEKGTGIKIFSLRNWKKEVVNLLR